MTTYSKKWAWNKITQSKHIRRIFEQTLIVTQRLRINNPNTEIRLQFLNNSAIVRLPTYDRN